MSNDVLSREKDTLASAVEASKKPDKKQSFRGIIKSWFNPAVAFLLAVVLILGCVVCFLSGKLSADNKIHTAIYDKSQKVELAGKTDRINLSLYGMGDVAIPAIEGVPVSKYDDDNFRTDNNGFKYYYDNSELCSYVGVDVSDFNGDIDWQAVKDSGVDFAMLRIGGRGYGYEGTLYDDTSFRTNLHKAKEAGLYVGAYFFSQAITPEEAEEEAEYALSILRGASLDYPLAFDWEVIGGDESARTDGISPEVLTQCARAFCDKVKKAGYTPALYTGSQLAYYKYDLGQLSDIDIWYASYSDTPDFYYNYTIWQYSCTGVVEGIEGSVDLNICFKNYK